MDTYQKLENELIARVTGGRYTAPPFPQVAMKLRALIEAQADFAAIAKVVAADGALAAALLSRANSANFAGRQPATTINAALSRLGTKEIVALALASSLGARFQKEGLLSPIRFRVWRDSLVAANLAREIANERKMDAEEAFTAALVHDLGKIIALTILEELSKADDSIAQMEQSKWLDLVNNHNTPIGLVVSKKWNLPKSIVEAIDAEHQDSPMPKAVHLSLEISRLLSRHGIMTEEDLDRFSFETDEEKTRVWNFLGQVAEIVAAFVNAPGGTSYHRTLVIPEQQSPIVEEIFEDEIEDRKEEDEENFLADLYFGSTVEPCAKAFITEKGIIVHIPTPVVENALVKVNIKKHPELLLWGQIKGTSTLSQNPPHFAVEVQPFGTPKLMKDWAKLNLYRKKE